MKTKDLIKILKNKESELVAELSKSKLFKALQGVSKTRKMYEKELKNSKNN